MRTGQKPLNNINIEKDVIEHIILDSSCGGDLFHIKEWITYKVRNELKVTKSKELESIFIKIQNNHQQKNVIIACIYQHPCMDLGEFNDLYLQNPLDTLAFENKDIFLMGDFNINVLVYDNSKDSQDFLDRMHSNFLLPNFSSPYRVPPRSQTLTGNIFSNKIEADSSSGNITTKTISDHYA